MQHYFGVEVIHVPVRESDARMDVVAARHAINENTILLVGSAPQYPHGVVDPIEDLSELARETGLPLHVDACFGGFMLPWIERLGYPVPLWDFRVKGVTSISADIHKYGYSSKGASVVVYRSDEFRKFQYYAYCLWPGGLFGSPSMAGAFLLMQFLVLIDCLLLLF
jgi:sphinganine-1-phosphate aldolase